MSPIRETPKTGDVVYYINRKMGVQCPVKVLSVSASVCVVEFLAGGLNNSLKGRQIRAHVALLYKQY